MKDRACLCARRADASRADVEFALIGHGAAPQRAEYRAETMHGLHRTVHRSPATCGARQDPQVKTTARPARNVRPFILPSLMGCASDDLYDIVVPLQFCDSAQIYSLRYDSAFGRRVPMRRAVFRALRRGQLAARRQRSNRRGALFHRTDGASSQAIERSRPSVDRRGRRQDNRVPSFLVCIGPSSAGADLLSQMASISCRRQAFHLPSHRSSIRAQ